MVAPIIGLLRAQKAKFGVWFPRQIARAELRELVHLGRKQGGIGLGIRFLDEAAPDREEYRELVLGLVKYLCRRKRLRRRDDPGESETFWATELVTALFKRFVGWRQRRAGLSFAKVADAFEWFLSRASPAEKDGEISRLAFEFGLLDKSRGGGFSVRQKQILLQRVRRVRRQRGVLLADFEDEFRQALGMCAASASESGASSG
jgi:hypothetical protein